MTKMLSKVLKNLIRVGEVSSINYDKGRVRVTFKDKDNIVSDELPYLAFEYEMPKVQDTVLCVFLGNGISRGFCLGKFFNDKNPPKVTGDNVYYKDFFEEGFLKYDKETKTLTISFKNVEITGDTKVQGNLSVSGDISTNGNISAVGNISGLNISAKGNVAAVGTVTGINVK